MVRVNTAGARRGWLQWAVESRARVEIPGRVGDARAAKGVRLGTLRHTPAQNVALETALHEETERRALNGELSMLEAMWRETEEIAAIAGSLPDDLPTGEPPRT